VRLLAIKVALKPAEYDRAEHLLAQAAELDEQALEHCLSAASLADLQADYGRARALLEQLNRAHPRTPRSCYAWCRSASSSATIMPPPAIYASRCASCRIIWIWSSSGCATRHWDAGEPSIEPDTHLAGT